MSVIDKIQKRRNYPAIIDGEAVHLRSLSYCDRLAVDSVEGTTRQLFYAIGISLLEESGSPAFTRGDDETATAFADRVEKSLSGISTDAVKELSAAITKITAPPSVDAIVKNSDPTDSLAS